MNALAPNRQLMNQLPSQFRPHTQDKKSRWMLQHPAAYGSPRSSMEQGDVVHTEPLEHPLAKRKMWVRFPPGVLPYCNNLNRGRKGISVNFSGELRRERVDRLFPIPPAKWHEGGRAGFLAGRRAGKSRKHPCFRGAPPLDCRC